MITGFVFVMMLVIEYFNVLTFGVWKRRLSENRWGQYLLAAVLGIIPGCLGSFTAVTMCSHQMLTIGAVVTTMIVTSGDESFIMLSMIPKQAVLIWVGMFFIGIFAGVFTDFLGNEIDYSSSLEKADDEFSCCATTPLLHEQIQRIIHKND